MVDVVINKLGVRGADNGDGTISLIVEARPTPATITQTLVVLAAGVSTALIAANPARKYLGWMNIGANPATVVPGAGPAVAGSGWNCAAGEDPARQGGSMTFDGAAIPTSAFTAISTAGTTICVLEG